MSLCDTIDTLAMVYLDHELDAAERRELELHLHDCATCREHVAAERKSRVVLRARLAAPPAPALFRARLDRALDGEDKVAAGVRRGVVGRWILPGAAGVAAAAALVVFAAMPSESSPPEAADRGGLPAEAVRVQAQARPLEVHGPSTRMWLAQNFTPGVAVPRFENPGIREVGARLVQVGGYEGAQIFYQLPFGSTYFELYAVVLAGVPPRSMRGSMRVAVESGEMWVTELEGPRGRTSVVSYVDAASNGYMFMSNALSPQALLDVVVETDLIRMARARIR